MERIVAIKASKEQFSERFEREARAVDVATGTEQGQRGSTPKLSPQSGAVEGGGPIHL
jgi:hypothetical protein